MPTSDLRHPHFETFAQRARRQAREDIRRFLDAQERRNRAMEGRRILPVIADASRPEVRA
ncbi:hypothetical protein H9Q09_01075 [Aurantimonas sp. DM33-3]|uniref:hypothetical protein n=1 Tax=Aurantimonas sp. DM33-3 TaxID=2766955 RepID=UPI001652404D|nr:hypothetical protein [Aurantimonas sp. DM33-3]MBC6714777.1 hypothetical protein [Aurantimonas sp. DM33-3]